MTATAAEALELALWLHRAPARRAALLGRPLPDGIGQLLRVAGGSPDQVAAAATITGQDEATVLEAVRFYLQQVLFHDEADAYRVLGLSAGATHAQAREHHRLLQQWLHPDRSGEDAWESVYAVRINQAWSQLRTPQGRAAYDASRGLRQRGEQDLRHAPGPHGNRQGNEYRDGGRTPAPLIDPRSRTRSRNLTLVVLLGCVGLLLLIAGRQETPPQWLEDLPGQVTQPAPPTGDAAALLATLGDSVVDVIPAPRQPAASPSVPAPQPVGPAEPVVSMPVRKPPDARQSASTPALVVASALPDTASELAGPPPAVVVAVASARPPAPVALPVPGPVSGTPVPAQSTPPAIARAVPVVQPPPIQVPDAFGRMTQAQDRTRAVLGYLGDASAGLPPVWNDVGTMQQAERIRAALHARHGQDRRVPLELQGAQWRLSADGARLESRYRAGGEEGRIDLAFRWREKQLLVSDISLDPDS